MVDMHVDDKRVLVFSQDGSVALYDILQEELRGIRQIGEVAGELQVPLSCVSCGETVCLLGGRQGSMTILRSP